MRLDWLVTEATLTAEFLDLALHPKIHTTTTSSLYKTYLPHAICIHPLPSHVHFDFVSLVSAGSQVLLIRRISPLIRLCTGDTGQPPHNPSPSNRGHPPFPTALLPRRRPSFLFSLSLVPEHHSSTSTPPRRQVFWLLALSNESFN